MTKQEHLHPQSMIFRKPQDLTSLALYSANVNVAL